MYEQSGDTEACLQAADVPEESTGPWGRGKEPLCHSGGRMLQVLTAFEVGV